MRLEDKLIQTTGFRVLTSREGYLLGGNQAALAQWKGEAPPPVMAQPPAQATPPAQPAPKAQEGRPAGRQGAGRPSLTGKGRPRTQG